MVLKKMLSLLKHHSHRHWFVTGELGVPEDVNDTIWKAQHHSHRHWFVTGELGVPEDVNDTIWKAHYIPFATLFTFIMLFILVNVVGQVQDSITKRFMRRNHFLWVNVALLYFCVVTVFPMFLDPYENRRHMKPIAVRQAVILVVRLRLPCMSLGFMLIHNSLLNITELRLYATRWSNVILVYTLSIIHFSLIIISTVSTMFGKGKGKYYIVWLLCDTYTCVLFLFYAIVSTYTGCRILHHYHRDVNVFRKVIISQCGHTNTGFENENENNGSATAVSDENGEQNVRDIKVEKDKVVPIPEKEVEDIDLTINNSDNNKHEDCDESKCGYDDEVFSMPKRGSQFPIYRSEKKPKKKKLEKDINELKVICGNRSMGSMPYQTRSSKFPDKSIVKVVRLTVVVSLFQLLCCVGMVVALWSAVWFDGHNLTGWKWYLLRTCLRSTELGTVVTMAYMVRRSCCC